MPDKRGTANKQADDSVRATLTQGNVKSCDHVSEIQAMRELRIAHLETVATGQSDTITSL